MFYTSAAHLASLYELLCWCDTLFGENGVTVRHLMYGPVFSHISEGQVICTQTLPEDYKLKQLMPHLSSVKCIVILLYFHLYIESTSQLIFQKGKKIWKHNT